MALALLALSALAAQAQRGWIMGTNVILRSEPSRKSAEVTRLQTMDEVKVVKLTQSREVIPGGESCDEFGYPWVNVTTSKGKTGWVFGRYLFTESSADAPGADLPRGGRVQVILAVDESQGPSNEEGIISCETLTLVMLEETGASAPAPISMGGFRHLNETRGRSDDKEATPSEWLLLGADSGHEASIQSVDAATHEGRAALRMVMFVGYQEGWCENVLTITKNEAGVWEVVEYERGEAQYEERD